MPGAPHETMILLLRERPEWLRALVEVVTKRILPRQLTLTDSATRVVDPAEVRLDLVFTAADGTSWVLVEVQLDKDAHHARVLSSTDAAEIERGLERAARADARVDVFERR